jgi:hypothetical protein
MGAAVDFGEIPFGIREIQVAPWTSGALGSWIDVPGMTMTVRGIITSNMRRANDQIIGVHREITHGEFEIEPGSYPLDAINTLYSGTLTDTGVSPNRVRTLVTSVADALGAFSVRGRAVAGQTPTTILAGTQGGDLWLQAWLCLTTSNKEVTLQGENWLASTISGIILEHPTYGLFQEIQHETAQALS